MRGPMVSVSSARRCQAQPLSIAALRMRSSVAGSVVVGAGAAAGTPAAAAAVAVASSAPTSRSGAVNDPGAWRDVFMGVQRVG